MWYVKAEAMLELLSLLVGIPVESFCKDKTIKLKILKIDYHCEHVIFIGNSAYNSILR